MVDGRITLLVPGTKTFYEIIKMRLKKSDNICKPVINECNIIV